MAVIALFDSKRDPKQSQRQQTNSIIKAIEMLWTRKLHERLRGLDQCGASEDYVALFKTSKTQGGISTETLLPNTPSQQQAS